MAAVVDSLSIGIAKKVKIWRREDKLLPARCNWMGSSRGPKCRELAGTEQWSRRGGELRLCGGGGGKLGSCGEGGGELGPCDEGGYKNRRLRRSINIGMGKWIGKRIYNNNNIRGGCWEKKKEVGAGKIYPRV